MNFEDFLRINTLGVAPDAAGIDLLYLLSRNTNRDVQPRTRRPTMKRLWLLLAALPLQVQAEVTVEDKVADRKSVV